MVLFVPQLVLAQTSFVEDILWRLVNAVFGYAAAVGGMTLDYAVTNYVVGFGENFRDSGTGNSVDILWTIVRDVFNLTFIFGLVYIGLKMILRSGDSQARSTLVSLVLAALLVNFSLFITKFVIDFANIAAAQIAGAFMRDGTYQISASFMNIMGQTDAFNSGGSLERIAGTSAGFTFIFSMLFLYIVLAFVFLAGGIMLIIRYVVLIIYMILSPVMFLGWVFPGFAGASQDFWRKFLSRAFFAPAYLLMLYFSNQVLVNMRGSSDMTAGNTARAFSGDPGGFAAVFPFFFMSAGFLIASLVVAQKMGSVGADTAMSMGKRVANRTRKIAVGTTTMLPRVAVNYAGGKVEKGLNRIQTKNFSNSGRVMGTLGAVARTNAIDRTARGAAVGMVNAQLGTGSTNKAGAEYKRATMIRANQTEAELKRAEALKRTKATLEKEDETAENLNTALEDLTKVMKDMTDSEKESLVLDNKDDKNFKTIAVNLSDGDIEKMEKSGKFSASEIGAIKGARSAGYKSIAQTGHTFTTADAAGNFSPQQTTHTNAGATDPQTGAAIINRRQKIATMSTKDAGKLPVDIFKSPDMFSVITPAMLEERMRNGLSSSDLPDIKLALERSLNLTRGTRPSEVKDANGNQTLARNPWFKWETGNSTYAAQFFA